MDIRCEYCGSMIEETAKFCPSCGAANKAVKRTTDCTPKTIMELQQWYMDRHLPPYETTRFFIGHDYRGAKAYGIYQNGKEFVVYKNKADGSRAIRYAGTDEAYAVNELYMKLREEILHQKENQVRKRSYQSGASIWKESKDTIKDGLLTWGIISLSVIAFIAIFIINIFYKGFAVAFFVTCFTAPIALAFLSVETAKASVIERIFRVKPFRNVVEGILEGFTVFVLCFLIVYLPLHEYKQPHYYTSSKESEAVYCVCEGDWYSYDYSENHYEELSSRPADITRTSVDSLFSEHDDWNTSYFTRFEDTYTYESTYGWDSDSSGDSGYSSYDWDSSDSWDSSGSDWDSDW